jgi:hypothetical protein
LTAREAAEGARARAAAAEEALAAVTRRAEAAEARAQAAEAARERTLLRRDEGTDVALAMAEVGFCAGLAITRGKQTPAEALCASRCKLIPACRVQELRGRSAALQEQHAEALRLQADAHRGQVGVRPRGTPFATHPPAAQDAGAVTRRLLLLPLLLLLVRPASATLLGQACGPVSSAFFLLVAWLHQVAQLEATIAQLSAELEGAYAAAPSPASARSFSNRLGDSTTRAAAAVDPRALAGDAGVLVAGLRAELSSLRQQLAGAPSLAAALAAEREARARCEAEGAALRERLVELSEAFVRQPPAPAQPGVGAAAAPGLARRTAPEGRAGGQASAARAAAPNGAFGARASPLRGRAAAAVQEQQLVVRSAALSPSPHAQRLVPGQASPSRGGGGADPSAAELRRRRQAESEAARADVAAPLAELGGAGGGAGLPVEAEQQATAVRARAEAEQLRTRLGEAEAAEVATRAELTALGARLAEAQVRPARLRARERSRCAAASAVPLPGATLAAPGLLGWSDGETRLRSHSALRLAPFACRRRMRARRRS